jgi:glycine cleavage system regulatory protein
MSDQRLEVSTGETRRFSKVTLTFNHVTFFLQISGETGSYDTVLAMLAQAERAIRGRMAATGEDHLQRRQIGGTFESLERDKP